VLKDRFVKIPDNVTKSGSDINLTSKQFGELCKIIYFVLTKELPSLKLLSDYFNSMISIFAKLNLPVTWFTPAGLKFRYSYINF
jgi:hypothetical protein